MKFFSKRSKYIWYFLSFFIPFAILVVFCISRTVGIFGNHSLFVSDSQQQYIAFLTYLRENGYSNFYSLSKGLGGGMFGTFAYYLSSPFNVLLFLFPKNQLDFAFIVLIILKISLCGFTMFYYLRHKFKVNDIYMLLFSSSYALMAFNVNYYFDIMWLDGVILLPIILFGIDKIINERKSMAYLFSLALAIIANFYIGYILCICSLVYFIYSICLKYKFKKDYKLITKLFIKFSIASLLAGAMSIVILLPAKIGLDFSVKQMETSTNIFGYNFNFFDFWSSTYFYSNNYDYVLRDGVISIYSGIICLPLLYFFFVNKKIDKRKKVCTLGLLIFLYLSFSFNLFNCIWHGLSFPVCFSYRFSFFFSFIILLISYESFKESDNVSLVHYFIYALFYIIMSFITMSFNYKYINYVSIYVSVFLCLIYLVLIYYFNRYTKNKDLRFLLFFLVIAELFGNLFFSLLDYEFSQLGEYDVYMKEMKKVISSISSDEYRVEKSKSYSMNDGILLNYKGINSFSSLTNYSEGYFLKANGVKNLGYIVYYYNRGTMVLDSILGVKNLIADSDKSGLEKIDSFQFPRFSGYYFNSEIRSSLNVYNNPYALKLGYMISGKFDNNKKISNAFEYQNYILNSMLGNNKKYFKNYKIKKVNEALYQVDVDDNNLVYIHYPFTPTRDLNVNILIDGKVVYNEPEIFAYKDNLSGKKLKVVISGDVTGLEVPSAASFDNDAFEHDIKELQENEMDFDYIKDGHIKGKVVATSDKKELFLSIPYEKGWTLYVDGKKEKIDVLYSTFMGAKLTEGEHTIELIYHVPGLKLGAIISLISLLISVIYLKFEKKVNKKLNCESNY